MESRAKLLVLMILLFVGFSYAKEKQPSGNKTQKAVHECQFVDNKDKVDIVSVASFVSSLISIVGLSIGLVSIWLIFGILAIVLSVWGLERTFWEKMKGKFFSVFAVIISLLNILFIAFFILLLSSINIQCNP